MLIPLAISMLHLPLFFVIKGFFRISNYATVSTERSVYIIGGYDNFALPRSRTSAIKEFNDGRWRHAGNMAQARSYHGAIYVGGKVLIIGGKLQDSAM